ncbi:hypothetical protein [Streptomyces melanogenes]|uniref:hypothetical protein n=1 Tax=Streptomyces melanogenes TaxID=67326 RepID=UPI00167E3717|nr:hypothetical protein [Streptomyces melanogenes]GGP37229.1 hypothetical protein GCM10010278_12750 [Streptomyces melanogenes]
MARLEPRPAPVELHHPQPLTPYASAASAVDLYGEREPVVWVPDAYGRMVPMPKHLTPPPVLATQPRDLTPLPLLDPIAQRFIGAGIGGGALSAGVGYGIGQIISSAAGFGSGAAMWIAFVILGLRMPARALTTGQNGTTVHIRKAVIKRNHFHG